MVSGVLYWYDKAMQNSKYSRLRSLAFSFFIFLFFLLYCKPAMAETAETDEFYEIPELVVYAEGFVPLDRDAFVYVFADTKIMRPIIELIPVDQLKSREAALAIDRTEIAIAALFTGDTGRFFQIVGLGSYPNYIINIALAINRDWRYLFSPKDNYWYSDKDRLSLNVSPEDIYILGWRRSRENPVYEEPGVKTPEGFIEFRHRSGEPAPLSLWLENSDFILDRMFNDEGITVSLPIERLYLNLYYMENNLFKAELMLWTRSLFFQEKFVMNLSSDSGEFGSALKTLFFANLPVQNGRIVEFQSALLSEKDITSLFNIFRKNWK
jgi:hypothetical protein